MHLSSKLPFSKNTLAVYIMVGIYVLIQSVNIQTVALNKYVYGLIVLALYISEFFAFRFKIKLTRIRCLFNLTEGDPLKKVKLPEAKPTILFFYAYFSRAIFRFIVFMMFWFTYFEDNNNKMGNVGMVFNSVIILFEITAILIIVSPFFGSTSRKSKYEEEEAESRVKWQIKNFPLIQKSTTWKNELLSNIVIIFFSIFWSGYFWQGIINGTFTPYLQDAVNRGESIFWHSIFIIPAATLLCLFFVIPSQLAYFLDESVTAKSRKHKNHFWLALTLASLSYLLPTLKVMVIAAIK